MKLSEQYDVILPALMKARVEISALPLIKDRQGDKAKYLQLPTLLAAVEPALFANGLFIVQGGGTDVVADGVLVALSIATRIYHAVSGQWIENQVMIPVAGQMKGKNDGGGLQPVIAQSAGVSITYGRRYGIFAILSISVDDDTDGADKQQTRRARATRVVASIADATNARTEGLKNRLARAPKIVATEQCADCRATQGQPHDKQCPNAYDKERANA